MRRVNGTPISSLMALLSVLVLVASASSGCARHWGGTLKGAPSCAWNTELSTNTLNDVNVAAPDTAAAYWSLRYTLQPGLALTVKGYFPDARYMSFSTYDARFRSFTVSGVSSALADYQIEPDAGSVNPWRRTPGKSGSYTLRIRSDVNTAEANTLPLAPSGAPDGSVGYLILRAYLPAAGPGGIGLPTVTFTTATSSRTIAACTTHNDSELNHVVASRLPRAGAPLPNQQPSSGFRRVNATGVSAFPNVDAAYLKYVMTLPAAGQVLVVRGKAPGHPRDDHPAPWPRPGLDVRYLSLCSYPAIFPAPVTHNRLPNGTYDDGCRDDTHTKLDAHGFYTYIVGTESQRAQIEAVPSVTFVPISSEHAQENHLLLLRNLLANHDFRQAVQNVPLDASPEQTAAVMGDYYPRTMLCSLSVLAVQGISGCPLPQ
jgi:hypothetical protein